MLPQVLIGVLALVGAALFVLGLRRLWGRRLVSGSVQGLSGLLLLALAALAIAVALNLHTYRRLTHESPVAEVRMRALGPQEYRVYIIPPGRDAQVYELRGDEWQLDARILKWRGTANLLGLDTDYRLERLSGRYRDVAEERRGPHTAYRLSRDRGLDLWSLARRHRGWLPWVDAVYGSAAYMPMADGARFETTVSTSGLVARPLNAQARQAMARWH